MQKARVATTRHRSNDMRKARTLGAEEEEEEEEAEEEAEEDRRGTGKNVPLCTSLSDCILN